MPISQVHFDRGVEEKGSPSPRQLTIAVQGIRGAEEQPLGLPLVLIRALALKDIADELSGFFPPSTRNCRSLAACASDAANIHPIRGSCVMVNTLWTGSFEEVQFDTFVANSSNTSVPQPSQTPKAVETNPH